MSKKKVLMVHNFYQIGGGEHTVFKNEVEMLRENGHEVIEYTRSNDELKKSKWKMLLLWHMIIVIIIKSKLIHCYQYQMENRCQ